jgi:hypothetical protein
MNKKATAKIVHKISASSRNGKRNLLRPVSKNMIAEKKSKEQ